LGVPTKKARYRSDTGLCREPNKITTGRHKRNGCEKP